jgi:hypothetical protein
VRKTKAEMASQTTKSLIRQSNICQWSSENVFMRPIDTVQAYPATFGHLPLPFPPKIVDNNGLHLPAPCGQARGVTGAS